MKILFFLFCSIFSYAQFLTGTVVNEASNALPGAVIYVDGSSISTDSDAQGNFSLNLKSLSSGNLIIKKQGYETVIYPFKATDLRKLKVILTKENTIEEVKLLHYTDKNFQKYIDRFLNEFLGYERENVRILNPKDLLFAYDKDEKILRAKAKNSLKIENKALGYLIDYNLINFSIDEKNNSTGYAGTTFFK